MAQIAQLSQPTSQNTHAVILAGGQGQRVGFRQKGLLPYQGKPMVQILVEKLSHQVDNVYINANTEFETYQQFTQDNAHVFADASQGFLGPLAGMQAAWQKVPSEWIVFVPCDNPHLPNDFVERLFQTYQTHPAPLVVVHDGSRLQPLYVLMHRSMFTSLNEAIAKQHLSVNRWLQENPHSLADLAECCADAFHNMNNLGFYDSSSASSTQSN